MAEDNEQSQKKKSGFDSAAWLKQQLDQETERQIPTSLLLMQAARTKLAELAPIRQARGKEAGLRDNETIYASLDDSEITKLSFQIADVDMIQIGYLFITDGVFHIDVAAYSDGSPFSHDDTDEPYYDIVLGEEFEPFIGDIEKFRVDHYRETGVNLIDEYREKVNFFLEAVKTSPEDYFYHPLSEENKLALIKWLRQDSLAEHVTGD